MHLTCKYWTIPNPQYNLEVTKVARLLTRKWGRIRTLSRADGRLPGCQRGVASGFRVILRIQNVTFHSSLDYFLILSLRSCMLRLFVVQE